MTREAVQRLTPHCRSVKIAIIYCRLTYAVTSAPRINHAGPLGRPTACTLAPENLFGFFICRLCVCLLVCLCECCSVWLYLCSPDDRRTIRRAGGWSERLACMAPPPDNSIKETPFLCQTALEGRNGAHCSPSSLMVWYLAL